MNEWLHRRRSSREPRPNVANAQEGAGALTGGRRAVEDESRGPGTERLTQRGGGRPAREPQDIREWAGDVRRSRWEPAFGGGWGLKDAYPLVRKRVCLDACTRRYIKRASTHQPHTIHMYRSPAIRQNDLGCEQEGRWTRGQCRRQILCGPIAKCQLTADAGKPVGSRRRGWKTEMLKPFLWKRRTSSHEQRPCCI